MSNITRACCLNLISIIMCGAGFMALPAIASVTLPQSDNEISLKQTDIVKEVDPASPGTTTPKIPAVEQSVAVVSEKPTPVIQPTPTQVGLISSVEFPPVVFSLASEEQKRAYASGIALAHYILDNMAQQKLVHITLDKNILLAGIMDTFAGNVKMTEEDITQTLALFDEQLRVLTAAEKERVLKRDKEWVDTFAKQDGVNKTSQGALYLIENKGSGSPVKNTDLITVTIKKSLTDGTEITTGNTGVTTQKFRVSNMAPPLSESVKLIQKGGKIKVVIPPVLPLGNERSAPGFPQNAVLIYDMALEDIASAN